MWSRFRHFFGEITQCFPSLRNRRSLEGGLKPLESRPFPLSLSVRFDWFQEKLEPWLLHTTKKYSITVFICPPSDFFLLSPFFHLFCFVGLDVTRVSNFATQSREASSLKFCLLMPISAREETPKKKKKTLHSGRKSPKMSHLNFPAHKNNVQIFQKVGIEILKWFEFWRLN